MAAVLPTCKAVATLMAAAFLVACATPSLDFPAPSSHAPGTAHEEALLTKRGPLSAAADPTPQPSSTLEPFDARRLGHHPFLRTEVDPGRSQASDDSSGSGLSDDLARGPAAAAAALWWAAYKQTYSRFDATTCEFSPSCSRFGLEAVQHHGPLGFPMTFARLLRHHDHDFYPSSGRLLLDPVSSYTGWGGPVRADALARHSDSAKGWHEHVRASARLRWPQVSTVEVTPVVLTADDDAGHEGDIADEPAAAAEAVAETPLADAPFERYVAMQAAMEARLGTALFRQGDDYRAITSLKRYQLLDGSEQAHFMSHLMIGEIYRRNQHPTLALRQFEQAIVYAPDPARAAYGYLLGLQELCMSLSLYAECYMRLLELESGELGSDLSELVAFQKLYTEVVLRSPALDDRRIARFSDPLLRAHALELLEQHRAFDALPIKHPWLAGLLSGVIPGAGQAYNGRWLDGAIALGFNALFGAATYYAAAHLESLPLTIASGALTAGFYTGNILNAVIDARRINGQRIEAFFTDLAGHHWPRVGFVIDDGHVHFDYTFDWPGHAPSAPQAQQPLRPDML
jgi:hypothetical protein